MTRPPSTSTAIATAIFAVAMLAGSAAVAQDDLDCDDLTMQEAQAILDADPSDPNGLDGDGDGLACESDNDSDDNDSDNDDSDNDDSDNDDSNDDHDSDDSDSADTEDVAMPTGGVATGGGGTADGGSTDSGPLAMLAALAALGAGGYLARRRAIG